jgi:putative hydrolase of the HAD superfamily
MAEIETIYRRHQDLLSIGACGRAVTCMIVSSGRHMRESRSFEHGKIRLRAVVFDYGNVLCHPQQPSDVESMATVCRLEVPRFQDLYWKFRVPYDRGELNGDSYWATVAAEEGQVLNRQQIAELTILDAKSWSRPNRATLEWVEQLHGAGLGLGLLSNMPFEISRYLTAHCDWLAWFDSFTFSCDVGRVKPDPVIYQICLEKLKVPAAEVLFLDDIAANVEGACALGMHGLIFDTVEQTVARVKERFEIPVPDFRKAAPGC